jgi:hypothetical protein
MSSLGFTGTRNTKDFEERLRSYWEGVDATLFLREFDTYVTGGCRGWDAFIGRYLALRFPLKTHIVVCPANRSQVDPWWLEFDLGTILVVYMPEDTDYKDRNTEIVRRSDQLFYCADYPEEHGKSQRSGTWQTKRIAEKLGVPVSGIILNRDEQ